MGAGAAGLFAAIFAARHAGSGARIVALDGAKKLGAKILVAGGGRCNVTHHVVDELQYAGTSRHAIRNVLGRFPVARTIEFFAQQGVQLKQEETGKLFPISDDAHSVLDAILAACSRAGVRVHHPWRVDAVARDGADFVLRGPAGAAVRAQRVVLATGGMALPRTGSDGAGYAFAKALGHSVTPRVFPSLVPLLLPKGFWTSDLSGVSLKANLRVVQPRAALPAPSNPSTAEARAAALASAKPVASFTNSVLFTHFGLSGPAALDVSRYWTASQPEDASAPAERPGGVLLASWLNPLAEQATTESLTRWFAPSLRRWLCEQGLPERVAIALLREAGLAENATGQGLSRASRLALLRLLFACELPVVGDRGFTFAEVTAGGVPLSEVRLDTMESRVCPGLFLCGELLDVDGRVGGFNFQWAWASGFVAGQGAASSLHASGVSP